MPFEVIKTKVHKMMTMVENTVPHIQSQRHTNTRKVFSLNMYIKMEETARIPIDLKM